MSYPNNDCCTETLIHQMVKVQAQVTVTPLVKHGKPKVYCIETYFKSPDNCNVYKGDCRRTRCKSENCDGTFNVTQVFCIEIPISFDVDVDVDKGILCCDDPEFGPCSPLPEKSGCKD